jgi:hypothetical protein
MDPWLLDDPRQYECLRTRKTVVRITVSRVRIPPSPIYVFNRARLPGWSGAVTHTTTHTAPSDSQRVGGGRKGLAGGWTAGKKQEAYGPL